MFYLHPFNLYLVYKQIAIDGQHYCEYIHRQPYNLVDTLQIQGDVRISLIDFQFSQIYPPQPSVNRLNVVNPVILKKRPFYYEMMIHSYNDFIQTASAFCVEHQWQSECGRRAASARQSESQS